MNTRASANLAETGKNRPTLAEIRAEKQRLERQEAEIIQAETTAREQQQQRTIAAALASAGPTLEASNSSLTAAEAELNAAVARVAELARARDEAAEQLRRDTRQMRLSLGQADASHDQINAAVSNYDHKRNAVAFVSSRIGGSQSLDDALREVERKTHWVDHRDAGSLIVVITRKAG
jgi:ABC-type transporter Mla subunit MlaD